MGLLNGLKKASKKYNYNYDKIKVKEKISYDELYEIIKDGDYPIGQPQITGSGIMRAIRFEPMGKYQHMVSMAGKTILISKSYANASGAVKEMAGDAVTDGMYKYFNKDNVDGNEMVDVIGAEINRLLAEADKLAAK